MSDPRVVVAAELQPGELFETLATDRVGECVQRVGPAVGVLLWPAGRRRDETPIGVEAKNLHPAIRVRLRR